MCSTYVPLNGPLIDSLRVRIRLDKIKILDKRLVSRYIKYYTDLDTLENDFDDDDITSQKYDFGQLNEPEPYTQIINGITYRFYIKSYIDANKTSKEYLVVQISTKMLKHRYFEGINKTNYKSILDDINNFKVVYISEKEFLNGLVSDIDICINFLSKEKPLLDAYAFIQQSLKVGCQPLVYPHTRKGSCGLEFNNREKATPTRPYIKFYHKGRELLSKSHVFYRNYLEPMRTSILDNLIRYEYTLKASKHKKHLCNKGINADLKTFANLLSANPTTLLKIAQSGLSNYVDEKSQINKEVYKNKSPTDTLLLHFMSELIIHAGHDEERLLSIRHLFDTGNTGDVNASRMRKKIRTLLQNYSKNDFETIMLERNKNTQKILKTVGLKF